MISLDRQTDTDWTTASRFAVECYNGTNNGFFYYCTLKKIMSSQAPILVSRSLEAFYGIPLFV